MPIGLILTFIPMKIEITIILVIMIVTDITILCQLEMCSYMPNSNNMQQNPVSIQPSNTSDIIERLQSQILGLQMHPLQQSTLNSIKIFDGSNKAEFTTWVQSVENTARLCHLDTLSIALSKLQGTPLKSATYLETKEANAGKTLVWYT